MIVLVPVPVSGMTGVVGVVTTGGVVTIGVGVVTTGAGVVPPGVVVTAEAGVVTNVVFDTTTVGAVGLETSHAVPITANRRIGLRRIICYREATGIPQGSAERGSVASGELKRVSPFAAFAL